MVVTAQHLATEVGVDILKRGGNAIDAAVAVGYALAVVYPCRRQSRRRRLHDDPARRWPQDVHRLSRDGAARSDGGHVSRCARQRDPGSQHPRPSRGRRAGHGLGARVRAREVRHVAARGADRTGDPPRRARVRARPGRCRPAARGDRGLSQGRAVGGDLPQARPALRGRREAGAEGSRAHAACDRERGAAGFYKGPVARAIVAASQRRRRHHRASGSRRVPDARAPAARVRLSRLSHRLGAAAELGRRHAVPDAATFSRAIRCGELGFGSAQALHYQIEAMRHAYVDRNTCSAIRRSSRIRSSGCWTQATPQAIRAAIDPKQAGDSSKTAARASRRTKAATRRTTRSWTRRAMRCR